MINVPKRYWVACGGASLVGLSVMLNPWIVYPDGLPDSIGDGMLIAIGLAGIAWLVGVCLVRFRSDEIPQAEAPALSPFDPAETATVPARSVAVPLLLLLIVGLWLVMFRQQLIAPGRFADDLYNLEIGQSWASTRRELFTPFAEHLCVPLRLATWAMCATVPPEHLPRAVALVGMGVFAATFLPIYWFVRREFDSPALGVLAVSLFALTTVHSEIVTWYSASHPCWALLVLLASLLVLQAGEPAPRGWHLASSILLAFAGPFCHALGVLVGPLSMMYLAALRRFARSPISYVQCALPLVGTVGCLAIIVPLLAPTILKRADYGGRSAAEATSILHGVRYGVQSAVDVLVMQNLGVKPVDGMSRAACAALFPIVVFAVSDLIARAARPGPLILGATLVLFPYAVTFPFRAWVHYGMLLTWTRYQLFPQLGVVLLMCGALAWCGPSWLSARELSRRSVGFLAGLAALQFVVHSLTR